MQCCKSNAGDRITVLPYIGELAFELGKIECQCHGIQGIAGRALISEPMKRFANSCNPLALDLTSHLACSIPTPSLTSCPSPSGDLIKLSIFSSTDALSHRSVAKDLCTTSWRKLPQTTTSPGPFWCVSIVEDGGDGAFEESMTEMSGLRIQEGALEMVVAERSRSGWRMSMLEREVMVIVEMGLETELDGAEKGVKSPRTLMQSP